MIPSPPSCPKPPDLLLFLADSFYRRLYDPRMTIEIVGRSTRFTHCVKIIIITIAIIIITTSYQTVLIPLVFRY